MRILLSKRFKAAEGSDGIPEAAIDAAVITKSGHPVILGTTVEGERRQERTEEQRGEGASLHESAVGSERHVLLAAEGYTNVREVSHDQQKPAPCDNDICKGTAID